MVERAPFSGDFSALSLVLVLAYKGWQEDHALHPSGRDGPSKIIAEITVNLSGIPYREHCMTCHPQGKAANLPASPWCPGAIHQFSHIPWMISVAPVPSSGRRYGPDPIISHGRVGMEIRKVLQEKIYRRVVIGVMI